MIRTPNFVLEEDYVFSEGAYDKKTVPAGTFVRPIEIQYVPKHCTEDDRWRNLDMTKYVYCYYSGGIIPFPKSSVREK